MFNSRYLILSYEHRLYLIPQHYLFGSNHFHTLVCTPLKRDSR
nr:MAG TPA: hypothetical protein [Caudoviricetes sp.]